MVSRKYAEQLKHTSLGLPEGVAEDEADTILEKAMMLFKLLEDAKPLGADGRQRMQEELISHANLAKKMAMRVRGWGAFFGDMDRGSG